MDHYMFLHYGFPSSVQEKIRLINEEGFKGVFLFWDKDFKEIVAKVRETKLDIETVHLPFSNCNELWLPGEKGDDYVDTIINAIIEVRAAGVPTVVFHISSGDSPPPYNEQGLFRLRAILDVSVRHKVYFALENLRRLDYLDYVYSSIKCDYLKFCFDSGHANVFTRNIEDFPWNKYGDKLICVHLHDNNGESDEHLIPFSGNINWRVLARNLKAARFKGPLTCEAVYSDVGGDEKEYVGRIRAALDRFDIYFKG